MSNRFSRLEFEQPATAHADTTADKAKQGTPIRSASYHFSMAETQARASEFELALQAYTRALREDRSLIPAWVGQVQMLVELGEYAEARLWADKSLELFRNNGDLLAAKARACVRMRDMRAAEICSDASVSAPGSSPGRWLSRGEVMLLSSPARARDCFEKSLAEPGTDWYERVLIARAYLFHDKPAVATEFATLAQEMNPRHATPWIVLARCHMAHGRMDRAQTCVARALEIDPQNRIARLVRSETTSAGTYRTLGRVLKGWLSR